MKKILFFCFAITVLPSFSYILAHTNNDGTSRAAHIAEFVMATKCMRVPDTQGCNGCRTVSQIVMASASSPAERALFLEEALQKSIIAKEPQTVVAEIAAQARAQAMQINHDQALAVLQAKHDNENFWSKIIMAGGCSAAALVGGLIGYISKTVPSK